MSDIDVDFVELYGGTTFLARRDGYGVVTVAKNFTSAAPNKAWFAVHSQPSASAYGETRERAVEKVHEMVDSKRAK